MAKDILLKEKYLAKIINYGK